jgi:hypothetical protein
MKNRINLFGTYIYVHFFGLASFIAYLVLIDKGLIYGTPTTLTTFLWINIILLVFSVFFIRYRKVTERKGFSFNRKVMIALIFDLVFLIILTIDPFLLLAKAMD